MKSIPDTEEVKTIGNINLPGLFEAVSFDIDAAAQRGSVLWKTKNIAESGAPLEEAIRNFLAPRIPSPFVTTSGFLFDAASNCTPQIDLLILDEGRSHELTRSPHGASYVPFPAACAIGEIKSQASSVDRQLAQLSKILSAVNEMYRATPSIRMRKPLSLMVFARSDELDVKKLKEFFASDQIKPSYTIFLDRGKLIAGRPVSLEDFFDPPLADTGLHMGDHGESADHHVWEPDSSDLHRGRLLLWVFYALLNFIDLWASTRIIRRTAYGVDETETHTETQRHVEGFATAVQKNFPLRRKQRLAELTEL